jgi:hypothetical protein
VPRDESVLERLLSRLDEQADGNTDEETKQIFREVRDELKKLNEGIEESRVEKEERLRLERRYPAFRTRPPKQQ